jgi:hypothetical protein
VAQDAQGVQVSEVRTGRGRHATHERYRGRHRKPNSRARLRAGVRLAVTATCAALLVCQPQPSWASRTGIVARSVAASQAIVNSLPLPFRQRQHN